ncbi:hypothetical protein TSUD_368580 [Trifolium subterraneum]|uniref:Zinc finger PMZ-type domain-containing protein n=1 Tax=Trifolium subterraneum TaxID=3900 RepID=A0A2Z6P1R9_TRISU|nr:hypothetical protein TSUD_368580 [Trifolium subterraneum]
MKEVLWLAARATTVPGWQRAMQRMKNLNENAWTDMMKVPTARWTRSAYNTNTQCDLQVNNMCEAFNKTILEHRDKPIITLLEGLKKYISKRIVTQRELMQRYTGNICPKIQQLLEKAKRAADGWSPHWAGDLEHRGHFYVENGNDQYTVDLHKRTRACRKWDLTGIPCCHSITCMWHNHEAPEDYVAACYRKKTFMATYSHIIMPSTGPKLWPIIDSESIINPPRMRRAPGRPKKQRNKSNDEPKNSKILPRYLKTVECKKCKKLGHNMRTCKGKTAAYREIPKGGNKKQKSKKKTRAGESSQAPQPQGSQAPTVLSQGSQAPQGSQVPSQYN